MIIELLLTQALIGTIESHSVIDIANISEMGLKSRTVISELKQNEDLITNLSNTDPIIRINALNELVKENDNSSFEFLIVGLEDPDFRVRGTAAMLLGKSNNQEAVPYLILCLKDEHQSVRGSAALSLGRLKSIDSVDHLIKALNDSNDSVRLAATYSLGVIESQKAIKPIIKILNDSSPAIRENAAWVLGLLKSKEAVPFLELLLQDPDKNVRESAKKAIFYIKYAMISDTSTVSFSGGSGKNIKEAIIIKGIKNSFSCLRSQKEYISNIYGQNSIWEQVDQKHLKHNNKHYNLIIVKEANSDNFRTFYFDITELFNTLR